MASIFTKIIKGEIPAYKVAETDKFLAFLDISPLTKGHTLVIPKIEVDYLFDLDDTTYTGLHFFAREVARAIEKTVPCERIATAVVGLEVPHVHIHLVPINDIGELNFKNERVKLTQGEFIQLAKDIHSNLLP
ncbi:MAG: HIT family protein [Bacteroidetes bacterium]|nr:HIT family protein [Bacteroidota bacterium]